MKRLCLLLLSSMSFIKEVLDKGFVNMQGILTNKRLFILSNEKGSFHSAREPCCAFVMYLLFFLFKLLCAVIFEHV